MNIAYRLVFSLCIIFLLSISLSSARRCHVCNSHKDEHCASIIDDRHVQNCSEPKDGSNAYGCRKIEQWLDEKILDHEPEHRVIRQCDSTSDEQKDKNCIYRSGYGSRLNVCHCYEDDCNGASTLSALSVSLLGFILLSLCIQF